MRFATPSWHSWPFAASRLARDGEVPFIRQDYFDWAKRVVDGLPQVNDAMLKAFAEAYAARPES